MNVALARVWGWRPKVDRTIVDVAEQRLSFSTGAPIVVSRLDGRRGYYLIDGYHRVVEAALAGRRSIRAEVDPNVPRIERTGGAHRAFLEDAVSIRDYVQQVVR